MKRLGTVVLLTVLFVIMSGSAKPLNWMVAAVFAVIIATLGNREPGLSMGMPAHHPWRVVRFFAGTLSLVARGTAKLFSALVGLRSWRRAGLVDIPLMDRDEQQTDISGLVTSASPGAVLVGVDYPRRRMIVNLLDTGDADQEIEQVQQFYRRYQRPLNG